MKQRIKKIEPGRRAAGLRVLKEGAEIREQGAEAARRKTKWRTGGEDRLGAMKADSRVDGTQVLNQEVTQRDRRRFRPSLSDQVCPCSERAQGAYNTTSQEGGPVRAARYKGTVTGMGGWARTGRGTRGKPSRIADGRDASFLPPPAWIARWFGRPIRCAVLPSTTAKSPVRPWNSLTVHPRSEVVPPPTTEKKSKFTAKGWGKSTKTCARGPIPRAVCCPPVFAPALIAGIG